MMKFYLKNLKREFLPNFFIIILGLFIYLNIGTLLIERYELEGGLNKNTILQPIKNMTSAKLNEDFKQYSSSDDIKRIKDKSGFSHYLCIIFWPVLFVLITSWQWAIIAIKFIFFGGLIKFINTLSLSALTKKIIIFALFAIPAIAILFIKLKRSFSTSTSTPH